MAELVGRNDPLAAQDLQFDARFAADALAYKASGDRRILEELANSPAAGHLLNHARNFDYDVPKDSTADLVRFLMKPGNSDGHLADVGRRSLDFFTGPLLDDPRWVGDVLRYLPDGFRFKSRLFLTYGYDIGVAFPPNASLNGVSTHFDGHPREILYYAIHELHHVGFMMLRPPPRLADMKTRGDVLKAVEYLTQLEGLAVWAAYERRRNEGALSEDGDYAALADEERMRKDEALYWGYFESLKKNPSEPADGEARAALERLSGGERLWYRVGARMAARIEQTLGRAALVALIGKDPGRFFQAYRSVAKSGPFIRSSSFR